MDLLWARGEAATVRQVLTELRQDRGIAYTTVQTVMENLYRKGWLGKETGGRAHRYAVTASRGEYGARLMREALRESGDLRQTLLRFVGQMSAEESAALRAALDDPGQDRDR